MSHLLSYFSYYSAKSINDPGIFIDFIYILNLFFFNLFFVLLLLYTFISLSRKQFPRFTFILLSFIFISISFYLYDKSFQISPLHLGIFNGLDWYLQVTNSSNYFSTNLDNPFFYFTLHSPSLITIIKFFFLIYIYYFLGPYSFHSLSFCTTNEHFRGRINSIYFSIITLAFFYVFTIASLFMSFFIYNYNISQLLECVNNIFEDLDFIDPSIFIVSQFISIFFYSLLFIFFTYSTYIFFIFSVFIISFRKSITYSSFSNRFLNINSLLYKSEVAAHVVFQITLHVLFFCLFLYMQNIDFFYSFFYSIFWFIVLFTGLLITLPFFYFLSNFFFIFLYSFFNPIILNNVNLQFFKFSDFWRRKF